MAFAKPAMVIKETDGAVASAKRLAKQARTDYEGGKEIIMKSLGGIPPGHPEKPKEVADLITFLVLDRAGSVTGADYIVGAETMPMA